MPAGHALSWKTLIIFSLFLRSKGRCLYVSRSSFYLFRVNDDAAGSRIDNAVSIAFGPQIKGLMTVIGIRHGISTLGIELHRLLTQIRICRISLYFDTYQFSPRATESACLLCIGNYLNALGKL